MPDLDCTAGGSIGGGNVFCRGFLIRDKVDVGIGGAAMRPDQIGVREGNRIVIDRGDLRRVIGEVWRDLLIGKDTLECLTPVELSFAKGV